MWKDEGDSPAVQIDKSGLQVVLFDRRGSLQWSRSQWYICRRLHGKLPRDITKMLIEAHRFLIWDDREDGKDALKWLAVLC